MLQVSFTITEKEFLAYYYYMCWQRPERKPFRIRLAILGSIISFLSIGAILYFFDGKLTLISTILSLSAGLVVALLILFNMRSAFDKRARKMLERSGKDAILSPVRLTMDENGIFGKKETAEVKYLWAAFKGKAVYNNGYYLYINYNQALLIPFRAFQENGEKDKFESLLARHLPLEGFQAK